MQAQMAVVVALLGLAAAGGAGENPIRKVVRLMQDMQKEIEVELAKEKALFEKFTCICETTTVELAETAEKAEASIKELTSKLEEEGAEKGQLAEELKTHYKDKAAAEGDLNKATNIRGKEQAEQEQSIEDGKFNVAALGKAIPALEKGASAAALMQADDGERIKKIVEASAAIGSVDRRSIIAFLTGQNSDSPASGQVVGILKQMRDDMQRNLDDTIANEESSKKAFADLKAAKDEEIEVATESIEAKEKRVGELTVSIAQNTDALEDAKAELADSQKFLATLKVQCVEKKKEWDARFKLRNDEIAAISEAIKILNDDDALDVFKKAMPTEELQTGKSTGFLQQQKKTDKLQKVQAMLAKMDKKSLQLDALRLSVGSAVRAAQHGRSTEGPDFSAVVKMIDNMLDVLSKEQKDDEKKKAWCVDELTKADATEKLKQEAQDSLIATISELSDEIAGIDDEVKTLQGEIAALDRTVAGATEQRKKEHAEYTDMVSMTEAAIQLVGKAKNRLNKFYNPAAYKEPEKEAMFVQVSQHVEHSKKDSKKVAPPELPDVPELKPSNNGGIIGMMDQIVHELKMDMQQAQFDEKTAQKDYVELMAESQVSRAQDEKSIVDKQNSVSTLEEKLVEAKEQKEMAFEELNAAHTYVGELHTTCDFIIENFDLRRQARGNEIESLKNAKAVMQGA